MTTGTVDGMGFEELGQAGSQISSVWLTGSIVSDDTIKGAVISGTTAVRGTSIIDANGTLKPSSLGSPGNAGAIVQVGSFITGAGSTANVAFRTAFSAAENYVFWAFPQSGVTFTSNGSAHVFTSGAANNGKHTSGVNVVGGAAIPYDYIAIGI